MEQEFAELGQSFGSSYPIAGAMYGWIPFVIVILLSLLFATVYIHHFWNKHEHDRLSAFTSTIGLWLTLLTALLLPVDVFLISFMKTSDGHFKDWATNQTRVGVEAVITYTYCTFYSLIVALAFFFLPLVYFAYEEKEEHTTMAHRLCAGLRYTSVFFLFAVVLLIVGAFVPYEHPVVSNSTTDNMTDWQKFEAALGNIYNNKGQEALTFVVNVLTIIGTLALIIYTGIGLSTFPIENLRGWRSLKMEKELIKERQAGLQARISSLRVRSERGSLSATDLNTLHELEEQYQLGERMEVEVNAASASWWRKLQPVKRSFEIFVGICSMAFGLVLWVSLFIVNVDKVMHSFGFKSGYLMDTLIFFNPLSYVMVKSQRVFPIDYILYLVIVVFLLSCTISGIRYIGIWCCCIRMFKIRAHHTQPQGLIMLCTILMYTVLAFNILMYETIPQYTVFGSQHYRVFNHTTNVTQVLPCNHLAPEGECLMTRASAFFIEYTVRTPIFSMVYYWMSWGFLVMVVVGFFIVIISKKKSFIEDAVDPDDFDESDTEERPLFA